LLPGGNTLAAVGVRAPAERFVVASSHAKTSPWTHKIDHVRLGLKSGAKVKIKSYRL